MWKQIPINLSLLLCTILLFFGGIEVALRVTGLVKMHDYTPPIYERSENPEISYQLKPNIRERAFRNIITTNESGFRISHPVGARHTLPLQDTHTIAILGDSIAFGYGVADEEALPAQLQKLIPETTVINAGTPGYNIMQERALYEEKILPLDPDVLILVFYWNDFDAKTSWLDEDDILRGEGWQPSEKECTPIDQGILEWIPGKCWLDMHSAFYKGMKQYVNTRSAVRENNSKKNEESEVGQQGKIRDENITWYGKELQELAEIAPEQRLFIIWSDTELHETMRPKLHTLAENLGFEVLDLYDYFENDMETLSWDYVHPSADSLKAVANIISEVLQ